MIKFILLTLILLATIIAGPYLVNSQGFVHIATNDYVIETSLTTACIILVSSILILLLVLDLIKRFISVPSVANRFFSKLGAKKTFNLQNEAALAFEEGEFNRAYSLCKKSSSLDKMPNYIKLIMAKSAFELGKYEKTTEILNLLQKDKKTATASSILRANLNLKIGNVDAALKILNSLKESHSSKTINSLIFESYVKEGNFEVVIPLMPELLKQNIITKDKASAIYTSYISDKLKVAKNREEVLEIQNTLPKQIRKEGPIIASIIRKLIVCGDIANAKNLTLQHLKKDCSNDLLDSIALWDISIPEILKQLQGMESQNVLASQSNTHLLKAIGNLELKAGLIDEAKAHYEKALDISKSASTYRTLAQIYSQLNEFDKASTYYELAAKQDINN